jgi:hypothetical protein
MEEIHERQCRKMRFWALAAGLAMVAMLVLLPGIVQAQSRISADVLGTVTDQSGAVIPGAQVTIKNTGTGITASTKTSNEGDYQFSLLQIGSYELSIEAKGFKKYVTKDVALTSGDRRRVDAKLTLGAASETVSVSEVAAPSLQTDSSSIGSEIPSANIQDVPLSGRNLTDLVLMSAGVQTTVSDSKISGGWMDDSRQPSAYVVNGEEDMFQNNQLDGMDNNDRRLGVVEVKPSIDAIEEVKVQTGLYSAESGRTSGGVVQIVTKSGTNKFRGTAYEYLRNDVLDASTTWATTKPTLRQHQYGGTFGGPIVKNKTFFFGDYEGFRSTIGSPSAIQIPNTDVRAAILGGNIATINSVGHQTYDRPVGCNPNAPPDDPTACSSSKWSDVNSISPLAQNLVSLYPASTTNSDGSNCSGSNNYCWNTNKKQIAHSMDVRIDQHFNDTNTIYGRYSYNLTDTTKDSTSLPATTFDGQTYTLGGTKASQPQENISLDYTHVYRPNLVLDVKAGYTYSKNWYQPAEPDNTASNLGFECTDANCINTQAGNAIKGLPSVQGFGSFSVGGGPGGGPPGGGGGGGWPGFSEGPFSPLLVREHVWQYHASLNWTKGTHNTKYGVSYIHRQVNGTQSEATWGKIGFDSGGAGTAEFLEGIVASKARNVMMVNPHLLTTEVSGYMQDDWRVQRWLTLNLGVRYDLYTPYSEKNGYMANFDPEVQWTYNGSNYVGGLVSPDLLGAQHATKYDNVPLDMKDIQPRFGFAATLPKVGILNNTVLRGGFGMSYFTNTVGPNANGFNPPFQYEVSCTAGAATAFSGTYAFGQADTLCGNVSNTLSSGFPNLANVDSSLMNATATNPLNYPGLSFYGVDTHLKTSYMYQYSLQLQKDWRSNIISVGYVGTLGRHISQMLAANNPVNYNLYNQGTTTGTGDFGYGFPTLSVVQSKWSCPGPPGPCGPGDPGATQGYSVAAPMVNLILSNENSTYDSMQATFLRRSAGGLTTSINYTWAHKYSTGTMLNEGGGQDPQCTQYGDHGCIVDMGNGNTEVWGPNQYLRGNAGTDVRQRMSGVLTYELPFLRSSHGLVHGIAAGWTANLMGTIQTGQPFTVNNSITRGAPPGQVATELGWAGLPGVDARPNMTCNPNHSPKGLTGPKYNEWFDVSCFQLQAKNTFGRERPFQLTGPGMKRADFSLIKQFDLHENYKVQFRAEVFNISNTPAYGTPGSGLTTVNFACTGPGGSCSGGEQAQTGTANDYMGDASKCAHGTGGGGGPGGPPGGGAPGCITGVQGINRQMQFAVKLLF